MQTLSIFSCLLAVSHQCRTRQPFSGDPPTPPGLALILLDVNPLKAPKAAGWD